MNSTRRWEIDALRGLMLVLMTVTHLPTRLSSPLGQPFGFVSAAEGFVLLSAYMAGLVYSRLAYRDSIDAMRKAFWRRALKIYLCQAATLLFLFTFIAALGMKIDQPAVKDLISFYLQHPFAALVSGLVLIYKPPLLDILPLYILFMLASPWLLAWAMRHRWQPVLWLSFALWILAQFGVGAWLYRLFADVANSSVPLSETGSFVFFAWQFLWVIGLWMGASRNASAAKPFTFSAPVVWLAVAWTLVCLVWRHVEGQVPFGPSLPAYAAYNVLFDKWVLGPFRLLDLAAMAIVTLRFGPTLAKRVPRLCWIERLGAASLPVFCAQLVIVLLTLAFFGNNPEASPWWVDAALLASCFTILSGVAVVSGCLDEKSGGPGSRPLPKEIKNASESGLSKNLDPAAISATTK